MTIIHLVDGSTVQIHHDVDEALKGLMKLKASRNVCLFTRKDRLSGSSKVYAFRYHYGIAFNEFFHNWSDYTDTYRSLSEAQVREMLKGFEAADITRAAPGWQGAHPVWGDSPFPGCSHCHTQLPILNLGRQHFSYCDSHKFVVHVGENLLSGWRDDCLKEQQEQVSLRAYYRRIPSPCSPVEVAVREVVDLPF